MSVPITSSTPASASIRASAIQTAMPSGSPCLALRQSMSSPRSRSTRMPWAIVIAARVPRDAIPRATSSENRHVRSGPIIEACCRQSMPASDARRIPSTPCAWAVM